MNKIHLFQNQQSLEPWIANEYDIIDAVNQRSNEIGEVSEVLFELGLWLTRYHEEGLTDELLDDLNQRLNSIVYKKYVLPLDLCSKGSKHPEDFYVAQLDTATTAPKVYAADGFARLLTSGKLSRLKVCQLKSCRNFFFGPPQSKWCNKICGSKYRVQEKRRKDKLR